MPYSLQETNYDLLLLLLQLTQMKFKQQQQQQKQHSSVMEGSPKKVKLYFSDLQYIYICFS